MKRLILIAPFIRLLTLVCLTLSTVVTYAAEPVKIGVLAFRPKPQTLAQWQPLAAALKQAIPDRDFVVEALTLPELAAAVTNRQLDFVLTNPGHYVLLARQNGLSSPLATLAVDQHGQRISVFGGVIFSRAEQTNINTLSDIKNKTIAATGTESMGGYQMEAYQLAQAGIHLPQDAKLIITGMPHDNVVAAVLSGHADVGFVRSGVLEAMSDEGKLNMNQLKIINHQNPPNFPLQVSTPLYPEWPFTAMPYIDEDLSRHVAAALFLLEENKTAIQAINIHGFSVPADYTPVEDLLRKLRLPPFEAAAPFTLQDVWTQYFWQITGGILAIILISLQGVRLFLTRRKLESQHRIVLQQQQQLQESEHKLSLIMDNVDACIYLKDTQGRYLFTNRPVRELFSASTEEIVGQTDEKFFDAETFTQLRNNDRLVLDNGEILKTEEINRNIKDGNDSTYLTVKLPLRNEAGEIYALCGISTDITERKQLENAKEKALNLLQKIASRVPGVVYQYRLRPDGSSCFPFASEAIRNIYRVSPEDVRESAAKVFAIIHPDDYARISLSIQNSAQDLTPWTQEYRVKFDDGTVHWLFGNALPEREADGSTLWHGFITDITERKQFEQALADAENIYRTLANGVSTLIWRSGTDKLCNFFNESWLRFTGRSIDQELGKGWTDGVHPEDLEYCLKTYTEAFDQHESFTMEFRLHHNDDTYHWIRDDGTPTYDNKGNFLGYVGACTDITARKQAEEKLHLAASVFTHAREGIMITEPDGSIIDVNDAFTRITGYTHDEVIGCNPRILSSGRHKKEHYTDMWTNLIGNGHWYGEVWNRRKNGEMYAEMQTISAVRDSQGNTQHYVALFSDITAIKEHENELEHIAHYDPLTNLPNRVLLSDRLHQGMVQALRRGQLLAVAYLDLDGFKAINDAHGHDAGDQLLITVAARMKQTMREGDTLARLGGDEFVAVLADLADIEASVPLLTRLLAAAAQTVQFGDLTLQVSASLGVTFYPQIGDTDADQLLRQADQAMYQAKLAGKNRYHVFDAEQYSSICYHHESLGQIRDALTAHEFVLYYQPKVNMRTGELIGVEALIRWQHPEKGLLPPNDFLPVIEDHPLAIELGEWVIETALTQMETWHALGLDIKVSVNIGARQLQQPRFIERLREILATHPDIMPGCLELEVLETSALEDMEKVSQVIHACGEFGVKFALDDFGTGYSSLTYLKHLPVKLLKIDQSFIRDMLDDPDNLTIVEAVLGLATAFRLQVIAEGVETTNHGEMLLQLGCELAQGYGIARPMSADQLPIWAASWQPDPIWINLPSVSRDDLSVLYAGIEHRAWIVAMENYLKGERKTPPPLDHLQCRLGRWLNGEGHINYGTQPAFQAIKQWHEQVHKLAAELCDLQTQGRSPEALTRLNELHSMRDALLNQLKLLVQKSKP